MTPAIPAATLILVREDPDGSPRLLMVERAAAMVFAPGALVFPGGRIDPSDETLGRTLNVDHGPAIVAAVREMIEETAVPTALDPIPSPALALVMQQELLAEESLAVVAERHGLTLHPEALTLFAHWIPELKVSRRFDTKFFIAAAPPGDWRPNVGEREHRRGEWLSAAEALRRGSIGQATIIFPTRCNLERLAQHGSLASMLADVEQHPVEPVTPWIEEGEEGRALRIPGHLGYPVTHELLANLWRG